MTGKPERGAPDEAELARRHFLAFDVKLPNIRLWASIITCTIVIIGFIVPLASQPGASRVRADTAARLHAAPMPKDWFTSFVGLWNVGVISHAHAGFAANCAFCHETAFIRVRAQACLSCHGQIGQHADPKVAPLADISDRRCETCHHEHKGAVIATRARQADCVACHGNVIKFAPHTALPDVLDFGTDHPQFRPAVVQDAVLHSTRRFLVGDASAEDHSNVRFTHATHLKLPKLAVSACSTCHVAAPGGVGFKPVQFDGACASCHTLQFEPDHPEWRLPHGHPEEIASRIAGYYARAALAGETFLRPPSEPFRKPSAPAAPALPVGTELVDIKTAEAMMSSIARSTCGECHVTMPPRRGEPASAWKVAPVFVPDSYMPSARFSHSRHDTSACETCHAARVSNGGALVLLPSITTCRSCHAGEAGEPQRVASTCVSCHSFHNESMLLSLPSDAMTRVPQRISERALQ